MREVGLENMKFRRRLTLMEEYQFLGVVETVAVAMISVWILKYGNICRYFDYKGKLYVSFYSTFLQNFP